MWLGPRVERVDRMARRWLGWWTWWPWLLPWRQIAQAVFRSSGLGSAGAGEPLLLLLQELGDEL